MTAIVGLWLSTVTPCYRPFLGLGPWLRKMLYEVPPFHHALPIMLCEVCAFSCRGPNGGEIRSLFWTCSLWVSLCIVI